MKKIISAILAISILLASCGEVDFPSEESNTEEVQLPLLNEVSVEPTGQEGKYIEDIQEPFDGRIVIFTRAPSTDFSNRNAVPIIEKYGEDKIINIYWQDIDYNLSVAVELIEEMSNDPEIKIIITTPLHFSSEVHDAFEALREAREDIFIVFCLPQSMLLEEGVSSLARKADLVLALDEVGIGSAMARQAHKMGSETFVHFSPLIWRSYIDYARRNAIEQKCAELGMRFVEITLPEMWDIDPGERMIFIDEEIMRAVEEYGNDTAFFAPHAQSHIVWSVIITTGGILPQPDSLAHSPFNSIISFTYHAVNYISLLEDEPSETSRHTKSAIEETRSFLAEYNMLGRVSNWPVPFEFMFTYTATEYAIKWLNGEVQREGIDIEVLRQLMIDYAGVEVFLTPFTDEETGEVFDNFLLMRMDYIIY